MEITRVPAGRLKPGKYVLIDGEPCRVVSVDISAPGKHGSAKARVTAIGIFDGQKRGLLKPTSEDVEVPIIERKVGQIIAITGNTIQVMDMKTYEVFEMEVPEEFRNDIAEGKEVEYLQWGERRKIERIK